MKHECAQAGCRADATHVVIESHPLAMLLPKGAGLLCERCARSYADMGGVPCSIAGFLKAAKAEYEERAA